MLELNRLYHMDCMEGMAQIADGSIDMILCDLPYGTTHCRWDVAIPFEPLWAHYLRVIKDNGAIVLFSAQPFTTDLIQSNRKHFRYEIIWQKTLPVGFLDAKRRPLRAHENILVFYKKLPVYNPQKWRIHRDDLGRVRGNSGACQQYREFRTADYAWVETGERYPTDVVKFSNWNGALFGNTSRCVKHPAAKPVKLCEYLIRTYTNPHGVVLDNCMGTGTTAVAALMAGRRYIGFELDSEYCRLAQERLDCMEPIPNIKDG